MLAIAVCALGVVAVVEIAGQRFTVGIGLACAAAALLFVQQGMAGGESTEVLTIERSNNRQFDSGGAEPLPQPPVFFRSNARPDSDVLSRNYPGAVTPTRIGSPRESDLSRDRGAGRPALGFLFGLVAIAAIGLAAGRVIRRDQRKAPPSQ